MNSRSIAGVSHSTDSHSESELAAAGAPLMRTWRRSGAAGAVPVPISTSANRAATAKPPGPVAPRHLGQSGAAQAAPRGEQRNRLEHVGLAGAILAGEDDEARPRRDHGIGIGAEIGQAEARDEHAPRSSG